MKTKIIFLTCLLLAGIIAQAANNFPQGLWKVTQIIVEKNTDGNIQTAVYDKVSDVQSFIPFPEAWEINAQTIVLHYPAGEKETIEYAIENGRLTITAAGVIQTYGYGMNDGNLILDIVINNPYAEIREKWIFTLKK